jgi:hypothetical protein
MQGKEAMAWAVALPPIGVVCQTRRRKAIHSKAGEAGINASARRIS